jgi:hypothetical protein
MGDGIFVHFFHFWTINPQIRNLRTVYTACRKIDRHARDHEYGFLRESVSTSGTILERDGSGGRP